MRGFRLLEGDVGVENSSDHADVHTDEIEDGENVVAADVHAKVGDHDVLRTTRGGLVEQLWSPEREIDKRALMLSKESLEGSAKRAEQAHL